MENNPNANNGELYLQFQICGQRLLNNLKVPKQNTKTTIQMKTNTHCQADIITFEWLEYCVDSPTVLIE